MNDSRQDRINRLHASIPRSIAGHRIDKCDVCFLATQLLHFDALKEALEAAVNSTGATYYNWTEKARAVLKAIDEAQ